VWSIFDSIFTRDCRIPAGTHLATGQGHASTACPLGLPKRMKSTSWESDSTDRVTGDPRTGPRVGVVVLASGDLVRLGLVLDRLLPAAREYGALVRVTWPGPADIGVRAAASADAFMLLEGDVTHTPAQRRREAVERCVWDVIIVTEESQALVEPWHDVLALRCGLVRHPELLSGPPDWREALSVPDVGGASDVR
jgi:hypothetical protein